MGAAGAGGALAVIVANEPRAGLEAARGRAAVPRQPVQEPQAFPIKPAKGLLLQTISDHSPQEVLAQFCWRGSSEDHPPVSPKRAQSRANEPSRPRSRPGFSRAPAWLRNRRTRGTAR